jgi:diguanylate cyclase (GGDEF)-like protein/PAS domain S-box-containing protein
MAIMPRRLTGRVSLGTRTMVGLATALIGVSTILTAAQYRVTSRTLSEEWEAKTLDLARIIVLTCEPLLERGDYPALSRAVLWSAHVPETKSVTVLDAEGRILADSSNRGPGQPVPLPAGALRQVQAGETVNWTDPEETDGNSGRVRFILTPLRGTPSPPLQRSDGSQPVEQATPAGQARGHIVSPSVLGAVLIGADLSFIDSLTTSHLRSLLYVNGITFTALLIMLWIAIRISLVQPLSALTKTLRPELTPSSPTRSATTPSDEIGTLTETFSHLTKALRDNEAFTQAVLNSLPAHIAVLDKDGAILTVNAAWEQVAREGGLPFPKVAGVGANYLEACRQAAGEPGETAKDALTGIRAVLDGSLALYTQEYTSQSATGPHCFLLHATPFVRSGGGAVVSHIDITARKRAEESLSAALAETERARAHLDALYATIPIGLLYVTPNLIVQHASQLIAEIHGRSVHELIGRRLPDLIPPERWATLKPIYDQVLKTGRPLFGCEEELQDLRAPGRSQVFLSDYYADRGEDGAIRGIQAVMQDITALKQAQKEQMEHLKELETKNRELDELAIRDPLTSLYNRRFFDEVLAREWRRFQRTGEGFTVAIVDLDAFKSINDVHGHEAGDRALQQVGTALRITLRESDLVARIGGDEFAALLPRTDTERCDPVIEKLDNAVRKLRLSTTAGPIQISISLGWASVPGSPPVTSAAELLRVADKRMYEAKRFRSSGKPDLG